MTKKILLLPIDPDEVNDVSSGLIPVMCALSEDHSAPGAVFCHDPAIVQKMMGHTQDCFVGVFNSRSLIEFSPYEGALNLLEQIQKCDDGYDTVMVAAPKLFVQETLVPFLTGESSVKKRLGKAAMLEVSCPTRAWGTLTPKINTLSAFYRSGACSLEDPDSPKVAFALHYE